MWSRNQVRLVVREPPCFKDRMCSVDLTFKNFLKTYKKPKKKKKKKGKEKKKKKRKEKEKRKTYTIWGPPGRPRNPPPHRKR